MRIVCSVATPVMAAFLTALSIFLNYTEFVPQFNCEVFRRWHWMALSLNTTGLTTLFLYATIGIDATRGRPFRHVPENQGGYRRSCLGVGLVVGIVQALLMYPGRAQLGLGVDSEYHPFDHQLGAVLLSIGAIQAFNAYIQCRVIQNELPRPHHFMAMLGVVSLVVAASPWIH